MSKGRRFTRFSPSLLILLLALCMGQAAHASQSVEGTLTIVWGDPHPDAANGGETRYALALSDGTVMRLQLDARQQSAAVAGFGQRATVSGLVIPEAPDGVGGAYAGTIVVDSLQLHAKAADAQLGTRKVLYLLVKFAGDTAVPHPPAFYTNLNNPDVPPAGEVFPTTINGFFKKTSWNQFSWDGDVGGVGGVGASGGWLTLPHAKSHYAPCGFGSICANVNALADDALAAGRTQGIDFSVYDNINFVLSNDLDCCAWGGGHYSAVENKFWGTTWEPPWGQETGTYVHEMGHSLGLPHSGWVYHSYDSPWDMMSSRASVTSVPCGSYPSANNGGAARTIYCSEPGNGYIAAHKDYLGWIPPANLAVSNSSSSTTVTLEGAALPLGSAAKMLKICIDGVPCSGYPSTYFTVEARVKDLNAASQFDNAIPAEGVIIHEFRRHREPIDGDCYFNDQSGFALPIDSTPGDYDSIECDYGDRNYPDFGLYNAQWSPGQTYTNGFSVSVVSRSGSTFVVSTTGIAPPAVTAVMPPGGPPAGGTNITITGTSFAAGSTVLLGGVAPTNVVIVNPTTITATTAAHTAGFVDVVVTNPLEQVATLAGGYRYTHAPIITAHPQSQSLPSGGSTTLIVAASGAAPLSCQWYAGATGDMSNPIAGATAFSYSTPVLTATKKYWARVTNSSGSANSNTATVSIAFTDSTLVVNSTAVRRVHVAELRTRIDGLRSKYGGLAPFTYTVDPAITAGVTPIKAQHIIQLRAALAPAYLNATGTAATYATDPSLPAGTRVKAAHITELRALVTAIE